MNKLYLDLETFSHVDIKHGTYKYAENSKILLFAYAFNDEPAQVLDCTAVHDPLAKVNALLKKADIIVAHNSMFDRTVLSYHISDLAKPVKWQDTMVKAFAHSLPGSLDKLCDILGIGADEAKDKDGKKLIRFFCKPQTKKGKEDWVNTRYTHPLEWARFVEYARLDVEAMRAVDKKLPNWNMALEYPHWHLDQAINDRGFLVDVELVDAAIKAVDTEREVLSARTALLTGGVVESASQGAKLIAFIASEHDYHLENLQKATVEQALSDPQLPRAVKLILENRLSVSTTSTSKYAALHRSVNSDNRLRGTLQFAGASRTGRWAGRTFQPQNLPRPSLKQYDIDIGIRAFKLGCAEIVTDNIMELASSTIRSCITAPEGSKLVVSDLSNIEGRVQCWLANETWKLKAFSDFDKGEGYDLYKVAYAKAFGVHPKDVTSAQRQVGKVLELAMGYQGGVGAFVTFAEVYNLDLNDLADAAWDEIPEHIKNESISYLNVRKSDPKYDAAGMSERVFVTCDSLKRMWRESHSNINDLWYAIDRYSKMAATVPTSIFGNDMLKFKQDGSWLRIRLPSGRYLCYPAARVTEGKLTFKHVNPDNRKWTFTDTYGGKLFENICQAVSRDILAYNMHKIDELGYKIVLTVHDEVICETPDSPDFNDEHLSKLLAQCPPWAEGLPLAAGGFECKSYRKD